MYGLIVRLVETRIVVAKEDGCHVGLQDGSKLNSSMKTFLKISGLTVSVRATAVVMM